VFGVAAGGSLEGQPGGVGAFVSQTATQICFSV